MECMLCMLWYAVFVTNGNSFSPVRYVSWRPLSCCPSWGCQTRPARSWTRQSRHLSRSPWAPGPGRKPWPPACSSRARLSWPRSHHRYFATCWEPPGCDPETLRRYWVFWELFWVTKRVLRCQIKHVEVIPLADELTIGQYLLRILACNF